MSKKQVSKRIGRYGNNVPIGFSCTHCYQLVVDSKKHIPGDWSPLKNSASKF